MTVTWILTVSSLPRSTCEDGIPTTSMLVCGHTKQSSLEAPHKGWTGSRSCKSTAWAMDGANSGVAVMGDKGSTHHPRWQGHSSSLQECTETHWCALAVPASGLSFRVFQWNFKWRLLRTAERAPWPKEPTILIFKLSVKGRGKKGKRS